jgi:AcrR family transcriptional regulator
MEDDTGTGLPASIEAAWGLRTRPARGPRPALTLDRIVAAGIEVARAEGLDALSMARVARRLGVSTMSLYRYVSAKRELLTLMLDAGYGPPPPPPEPGEDWRAGLTRWARAERRALQRAPWLLRIPVDGPPTTPNQISWLEIALRCLAGTGLAEAEKMSVVLLVSSYVRAESSLTADLTAAVAAAGVDWADSMPAYGRILARLADPRDFPALRRVIEAGVLDRADPPEQEFAFGLDRILDGVEALVRTRTPAGGTAPPGDATPAGPA